MIINNAKTWEIDYYKYSGLILDETTNKYVVDDNAIVWNSYKNKNFQIQPSIAKFFKKTILQNNRLVSVSDREKVFEYAANFCIDILVARWGFFRNCLITSIKTALPREFNFIIACLFEMIEILTTNKLIIENMENSNFVYNNISIQKSNTTTEDLWDYFPKRLRLKLSLLIKDFKIVNINDDYEISDSKKDLFIKFDENDKIVDINDGSGRWEKLRSEHE